MIQSSGVSRNTRGVNFLLQKITLFNIYFLLKIGQRNNLVCWVVQDSISAWNDEVSFFFFF